MQKVLNPRVVFKTQTLICGIYCSFPAQINTEELSKNLRLYFATRELSVGVDCLHGDRDQADRANVMSRCEILV